MNRGKEANSLMLGVMEMYLTDVISMSYVWSKVSGAENGVVVGYWLLVIG